MSALAKTLKDLGEDVSGSDTKDIFFTDDALISEKIKINRFKKKNIKGDATYIVSSCYDKSNKEVNEIIKKGYKMYYYHDFLEEFFKGEKIGVSGTHGKTTTCHFLNCLFNDEKKVAVIGDGYGEGCKDYKYVIFEACEYKNHFLKYNYDVLLINNIDLDHLDFFDNLMDVYESFYKASKKSKVLIINGDDENLKKIEHPNIIFFGFGENCDVKGEIINTYHNGYLIDVWIKNERYRYILPIVGLYNIYNFLGALATYYYYNMDLKKVQEKLYNYVAPKRRMEEYYYNDNIIIDDYAHHPKEIKMCIEGVKQKYKDKELVVIFEPHTYSRTLKLKDDFEKVFLDVDEFYLAKTFTSKRETRNKILEKKVLSIFNYPNVFNKRVFKKIKNYKNKVILFLGAGNIFELVKKNIK